LTPQIEQQDRPGRDSSSFRSHENAMIEGRTGRHPGWTTSDTELERRGETLAL
jgi:hypothetical protein